MDNIFCLILVEEEEGLRNNAGRVTTIDPESDDYFKTLDKGGGPTDPLF